MKLASEGGIGATMSIACNDPERPTVQCVIRGSSTVELAAVPRALDFGTVTVVRAKTPPHGFTYAELEVVADDVQRWEQKDVEAVRITSTFSGLSVEPVIKNNKLIAKVALSTGSKPGRVREQIVVTRTANGRRSEVSVPVSADFVGSVAVAPTQLRLSATSNEGGTIVVWRPGGGDPEVARVEAPDGVAVTELPQAGSSGGPITRRTFGVSVTRRTTERAAATQSGEHVVRFHISGESEPVSVGLVIDAAPGAH